MLYREKYNEIQMKVHKEFCKKCPLYERAIERNTTWDFIKCSTLDCYKLSWPEWKKNYDRYAHKYKEKTELERFEERVKVRDIKALHWDEQVSLEDIGYLYGVGYNIVFSYITKHKLNKSKHRGKYFTFANWNKNVKPQLKELKGAFC